MSSSKSRRRRVREAAPRYDIEPAQRLLLDTHVWLWWSTGGRQIGPRARAAIRAASEVRFSVASAWEIAIKAGRKRLDVQPDVRLRDELAAENFLVLDIGLEHALGVQSLPPIHHDPFDRLLVSQALTEGLTIVTADAVIARYQVPVMPARE